jgi:hypothetical protein
MSEDRYKEKDDSYLIYAVLLEYLEIVPLRFVFCHDLSRVQESQEYK